MFPKEIEDLIFEYMDSMNQYSNLPELSAIKRLVKQCDLCVLDILGNVLSVPIQENRNAYRLVLDRHFSFHFRLGIVGRSRLLHLLHVAATTNPACARLVWLFIKHPVDLSIYPEYASLFFNSLFCRILKGLFDMIF